jgi:hypothetical protein
MYLCLIAMGTQNCSIILDKSGVIRDNFTFSVGGLWPNTAADILQMLGDSLKPQHGSDI